MASLATGFLYSVPPGELKAIRNSDRHLWTPAQPQAALYELPARVAGVDAEFGRRARWVRLFDASESWRWCFLRTARSTPASRASAAPAAHSRRLRPVKGDGKVTATAPNPRVCRDFVLLSLALSRRRSRVRVPSLPLRSRPQRAARACTCRRARAERSVARRLFAHRRALWGRPVPGLSGHWAIVRTTPAQEVEVPRRVGAVLVAVFWPPRFSRTDSVRSVDRAAYRRRVPAAASSARWPRRAWESVSAEVRICLAIASSWETRGSLMR